MIVQRVEKQIIKENHEHYAMLDGFCFAAKNLYNHANYVVRNTFCKENKYIRYQELDKLLRESKEYPDYRSMLTAQSAQQTLRLLDKAWTSFFKSIRDWSKHKEKYLGKPKLPNYKKKDGRCVLVLTNQNVKLKDGILCFPKSFDGFIAKVVCCKKNNFVSFQQVRFIPRYKHLIMEVVYNVDVPENPVTDNGRYLSVDIGIDNFATVTNNFGDEPFIINGKGLKSVNKFYNKQMSHYRSVTKRMNGEDYSRKMNQLTVKRNLKVEDFMHKASRHLVNYARNNNISAIVIGKNDEWKQKCNMSKRVNQTFVQIPFARFIEMTAYKAREIGISVITTEESYTSGTSFLDGEMPVKENYDKKRRTYRGLFTSNKDTKINADVNGSLQILKKVFPTAYANGIEGVALRPVVVNVCRV